MNHNLKYFFLALSFFAVTPVVVAESRAVTAEEAWQMYQQGVHFQATDQQCIRKLAIELLLKAAQGDDPDTFSGDNLEAVHLLGTWLFNEQPGKARTCWQFAADKGYGPAMVALGEYFENDLYEAPDYQEAHRLYEKAAFEQNVATAYTKLALLYAKGKGVDINIAKSHEYFEKAATMKDGMALMLLFAAYRDGLYGYKKDIALSDAYLAEACKQGIHTALLEQDQRDQARIFKLLGIGFGAAALAAIYVIFKR